MVLGKRKLESFRKRLEEERAQTVKLLQSDQSVKEIRSGERSPSDEADQALDLANQTLTFSMRRREMQKLREIDAAIRRIADGTFGICEETGDLIEEKRLMAQPWTRVSLEAAREIEETKRQEAARKTGGSAHFRDY